MFRHFFAAFFLLTTIKLCNPCPTDIDLSPCRCVTGKSMSESELQFPYRSGIFCNGGQLLNLTEVFSNMSRIYYTSKPFDIFYLNNTSVHEIDESTFANFTFRELIFDSPANLTYIHPNAFKIMAPHVDKLTITGSKLSNIDDYVKQREIFDALSSLTHVRDLVLGNSFVRIPSHAFRAIDGQGQRQLESILVTSGEADTTGLTVEPFAFYELPKLQVRS